MRKIFSIAKKHNLVVIEDAAHAIGSVWEGRKIGGLKNSLACFSFYPNKNITSIFLCVSNSRSLLDEILLIKP